jgi:hypothetical protein
LPARDRRDRDGEFPPFAVFGRWTNGGTASFWTAMLADGIL